jgi:hypothetical protein
LSLHQGRGQDRLDATYHALAQATYFGSIGTYGFMGGDSKVELKPLTVLDDRAS